MSAATVNETAAAFVPDSRFELQIGRSGCLSGDGRGNPCNNADDSVPSGQGSGTYGVIGDWDVAKVTSMSDSECLVFVGGRALAVLIADTLFFAPSLCAYVAPFSAVFYNAENFNQPLNDWDVARVTSMDSSECLVVFGGRAHWQS
jgi:surface protein